MWLALTIANVPCRTETKQGGSDNVIDDIWNRGYNEIGHRTPGWQTKRGAAGYQAKPLEQPTNFADGSV